MILRNIHLASTFILTGVKTQCLLLPKEVCKPIKSDIHLERIGFSGTSIWYKL